MSSPTHKLEKTQKHLWNWGRDKVGSSKGWDDIQKQRDGQTDGRDGGRMGGRDEAWVGVDDWMDQIL